MKEQWEDITDDHRDGWYWCESLPEDSPPQHLRSCFRLNLERTAYDKSQPRLWERWTTAGWVPLVGRVCAISPRPQ